MTLRDCELRISAAFLRPLLSFLSFSFLFLPVFPFFPFLPVLPFLSISFHSHAFLLFRFYLKISLSLGYCEILATVIFLHLFSVLPLPSFTSSLFVPFPILSFPSFLLFRLYFYVKTFNPVIINPPPSQSPSFAFARPAPFLPSHSPRSSRAASARSDLVVRRSWLQGVGRREAPLGRWRSFCFELGVLSV